MSFFRFTPVITNIILINIAVFMITGFLMQSDGYFFNLFALHYPESELFNPIQFFTYMFMHADGSHLFSNMLGILIFGPLIEEFWGGRRLLAYYLMCGLGAGILYAGYQYYEYYGMAEAKNAYLEEPSPENLSYFFHEYGREFYSANIEWFEEFRENPKNSYFIEQGKKWLVEYYKAKENIPMVGASGALFGILIAFGMLFPNTTPFIIPIPAKFIVALYGITAYFGVLRNTPGDHVAHVAHLSGMLVGFIIVKYWQSSRSRFY